MLILPIAIYATNLFRFDGVHNSSLIGFCVDNQVHVVVIQRFDWSHVHLTNHEKQTSNQHSFYVTSITQLYVSMNQTYDVILTEL